MLNWQTTARWQHAVAGTDNTEINGTLFNWTDTGEKQQHAVELTEGGAGGGREIVCVFV